MTQPLTCTEIVLPFDEAIRIEDTRLKLDEIDGIAVEETERNGD